MFGRLFSCRATSRSSGCSPCPMPGKGHGSFGEMQQNINLLKDTDSQNGAKKGENTFFGATCLHGLLPGDQYLNPVEIFVVSICSLRSNVVGVCLPAKGLPVPGVGGWEGAAPLLAEHHDGAFYVSRYLILQDLKHPMSLVDFTGRRTCHELSDKLLLWQMA